MTLFYSDCLETPLGDICLSVDEKGLLRTLDWKEAGRDDYYSLQRYYRDVELKSKRLPKQLGRAIRAYFSGTLKAIEDIPFDLPGTDFQRKVWHALCEIPVGTTCSYKDLAIAIDNPKAMRAVGMANNSNPIALIVPCHRVIGADGKMVGYGSGVTRKEWLLNHEGAIKSQGELAI